MVYAPRSAVFVCCVLFAAVATLAPTCQRTTEPAPPDGGVCGGDPAVYAPGTTVGSVDVAGTSRSFRVYVPTSYRAQEPAALVFMFHGGFGSGEQFQSSANMDAVAEREGFVTVYPDGSGVVRTWNAGDCCGHAQDEDVDDVAFVRALIAHLEASLCVDPKRIYASGMSNGAMLSHRLACELADRIAAIAPVAGTMMIANCAPTRPVPVLQIHGTADANVPWDGGEGCGVAGVSFTSVPDTMDAWAGYNECSGPASDWLQEGDGSCTAQGSCAAGADVVLCAVDGGGHDYPGAEPRADQVVCDGDGGESQSFSAAEVTWRFFAAHPMP